MALIMTASSLAYDDATYQARQRSGDEAQNDRLVITRRGKPAAVIVGVEGV